MWAKDVLYHRSCYQSFTSPSSLNKLLRSALDDEDRQQNKNAQGRAFASLCKFVEDEIIACPDTVTDISKLCRKYVQFLNDEGIDGVISYRSYLLKTRLLEHFGDALTFHRPQKRNLAEYVFSSNVPPGPLVEKCSQAMAALETLQDSYSVDDNALLPPADESPLSTLFKAALCLRSGIMDIATSIPFPPKPTDIGEDAASSHVPTALFNFLAWLFLGDSPSSSDCPLSLQERVEVPFAADHCHILSVAQDIIHCVTRGHVKTAKHVSFSLVVKHLSGSKKWSLY